MPSTDGVQVEQQVRFELRKRLRQLCGVHYVTLQPKLVGMNVEQLKVTLKRLTEKGMVKK